MVSGFLCPWNFLVCVYDGVGTGLVPCLVSHPVPRDLTWTYAHSLTGDRDAARSPNSVFLKSGTVPNT